MGERLPFRDASFGAVLDVVTLCFADNVDALLVEARRALTNDGGVTLGDVFANSPWGHYQALGPESTPSTSAHFLTRTETLHAVRRAGAAPGQGALHTPPASFRGRTARALR